jgi:glucose 1-dehydrogenase
MNSQPKLKGQSALITGANSAIALGNEGANVAVNYVSKPDDAQAVVDIIKNNGGNAIALHADVSNEQDVQAMFNNMVAAFGTVDILVNNAGLQKDAAFHNMSLADWQLVLNVNLTGQFLCAREAVREFLRRGITANSVALGKIICMSSVHEVIPWGGHVNYAASKGGVMMLMKSMAQELAPQKIRVNSIAPGAIQTPINRAAWETPEALNSLLTLIPYNRIGQPEDIGRLVAWLASDEADYITGTTIFCDGGMTLYPGFSTNG